MTHVRGSKVLRRVLFLLDLPQRLALGLFCDEMGGSEHDRVVDTRPIDEWLDSRKARPNSWIKTRTSRRFDKAVWRTAIAGSQEFGHWGPLGHIGASFRAAQAWRWRNAVTVARLHGRKRL